VGSYDMTIRQRPGWPASGRLDVFEANGLLRGRLPFSIHPGDELEFDLIPAGDDRFNAGLYRDGKLFNVEMGATLEFDASGDRATAVRLRTIDGTVVIDGKRVGR
jgi:hypothetical protein